MPIVTAEKMVFGGECMAHCNGKNVFVPYAIPGETLEVEITKSYRDYDKARIVKVLTPSEKRVTPLCPLYGTCGGCNMQHIDSEFQQTIRKDMLSDCFAREGIAVPPVQVIAADATGYRCRIQLHDGGFYAAKTNESIPIQQCPVATSEINAYLAQVPPQERPRGKCQLFADSRVCGLKNAGASAQNALGALEKLIIAREQENTGALKVIGGGKRPIKDKVKKRFSGTVSSEEHRAEVLVAGKHIQFDVRGFFQSNLAVLEKATAVICGGLEGHHALDMYSGAGTFSVFLADRFANLTLVEHNRDALVAAEQNLAVAGGICRHESYGMSGERWVAEHAPSCIKRNGSFDAVVIDPPRSGMERAVTDWLCTQHIRKVRSVSCDPATQARDIARLLKAGYVLKELYLLDFYPQTAHIESLACLEYTL